MTGQTPRGQVIQFDYDDLLSTDEDQKCLALSLRTIKMLIAQTDYYHWTARYKSVSEAEIDRDLIDAWASRVERELMLDNECDPTPCEDGCSDYLPSAPFISYAPNDPFLSPAFVPVGYLLPPWYTGIASGITGAIETDAFVNFASIPLFANLADLIASGLPRVRVAFEGTGQIEIQFVTVPQGGIALITADDDPLTAKFVNLASFTIGDIVSLSEILETALEGGIVQTYVFERDFISGGLHHLDITFLPNVGEGVLIGFGGGLRRISLCGLSTGEEMTNCCPEIVGRRINEFGQVETTFDGTTWGVDNTQDPRVTSVEYPNFQEFAGTEGQCKAAENVVSEIQNQVGILLTGIADLTGVVATADAVALAAAVIFSGGLLAPFLIVLVTAAFGFGHEALEAAMTDDVYHRFKCNLLSHVHEDGSFTDSDIANIHTRIDVDETLIANFILHKFVDLYDAIGLTNMARIGSGAGDSCDCDCLTSETYSAQGSDWTGGFEAIDGSCSAGRYIGAGHAPAVFTIPNRAGRLVTAVVFPVCDGTGGGVDLSMTAKIGGVECLESPVSVFSGNFTFTVTTPADSDEIEFDMVNPAYEVFFNHLTVEFECE